MDLRRYIIETVPFIPLMWRAYPDSFESSIVKGLFASTGCPLNGVVWVWAVYIVGQLHVGSTGNFLKEIIHSITAPHRIGVSIRESYFKWKNIPF